MTEQLTHIIPPNFVHHSTNNYDIKHLQAMGTYTVVETGYPCN